jgi:hypothetical protein
MSTGWQVMSCDLAAEWAAVSPSLLSIRRRHYHARGLSEPARRREGDMVIDNLLKRILPQRVKTLIWRIPGLSAVEGTNRKISALQEGMRRTMPQLRLARLELNILDHCNLRCKGCDHFAAIAREHFVSLENITSDLKRMSKLFDTDVHRIEVLGGEPLLHPQLGQILTETRKYFSETLIQLVTNGILLMTQEQTFWTVCHANRIVIVVTKYPIHVDYRAIMEKAQAHKVMIEYYGDTGRTKKTSWKLPLDFYGTQDPRRSFINCSHANNNVMLMEGRIYTCTVAPNIHIFKEVYGMDIPVTDSDYLDIYDTKGKEEVLDFLSRPKPLCCYCNVDRRSYGHRWERSNREMSEWTV